MRTVQFMGVGMCAIVAMLVMGTSVVSQVPPIAPIDDEISRRADYLRNQGLGDSGAAQAEAVLRECASLKDHPWAGEYCCGDGTGMNVCILIAPESGVVYTWHGCLGLYGWNRGTIERVDADRIELKLELPPTGSITGYLSPILYRVKWGERHYLVPQGEMQEFCEHARLRDWAFRGGLWQAYPLRRSEMDAPMEGEPQVPAPFSALLREEPFEAIVTSVGEPEQYFDADVERELWRFPITIDRGTASGIFVGMKLLPPGENWYGGAAEVVEVTSDSATLKLRLNERSAKVTPGTKLLSRPAPAHATPSSSTPR